jgi:6-phosphogluconolactonase (cycloisomerase 2 family)
MVDNRNASPLQVMGVSDATQEQQMRTADGTCRQNHFFASENFVDFLLALENDADSSTKFRIDHNPVDVSKHGNVKVRPVPDRTQKCLGR